MLKTNKKELKHHQPIPGGRLKRPGGISQILEPRFAEELLHDALQAHEMKADIDKVLAMKIDDHGPQENEHFSSIDFHRARGKWLGKRAQLKEIQAILLGGEK